MRALLSFLIAVVTATTVVSAVAAPARAEVTVTDSRGSHTFAVPPQRVVALTWSLVEHLVELGVTPVGVADLEGYNTWVVHPPVPAGAVEVGLRQEPSLERIAELEPDVILASDDQIAFVPQLETIAPVLHYTAFSSEHDNEAVSRQHFREIARLLDREAVAEARLADLDAALAALRQRVQALYGDTPPTVTVVRFADEARVRVYGDNSMSSAALKALGLTSGIAVPRSRWGFALKPVQELGAIGDGVLVYVEPLEKAEALLNTALWQAMPFVRGGRVAAMAPAWTYGGAVSVQYLAEGIVTALESLAAGHR